MEVGCAWLKGTDIATKRNAYQVVIKMSFSGWVSASMSYNIYLDRFTERQNDSNYGLITDVGRRIIEISNHFNEHSL
jgi:hypothetical protein